MVKLRLARYGTRQRPFYRIVAAPSRRARDGRFLEILGTYDPLNLSVSKNSTEKEPKGITKLHTERIQHWLKHGAQPSSTVRNILKRNGLLSKKSA